MKALLMIVLLSLTTLTSARSLHPDTYAETAKITHWDVDVDSSWRELDIVGGSIKVNKMTKRVELRLQYHPECPIGFACAAVLGERKIELPIVSVEKDSCGSVTIKAVRDDRPVDGVRNELIVRDFRAMTCEIRLLSMTTVELNMDFYARMSGQAVSLKHFFRADALK